MRSKTEYLTMELPTRRGFVNLTPEVERVVRESGVREGLVLVNAMHITASVFINDDEPGLHHDYERWLERLAPHAPVDQYRHNDTGEDNADAHLKRQVMGREVVVAITARPARLRPLGADLLRRVRRPPQEAGAGQGDRRVSGGSPAGLHVVLEVGVRTAPAAGLRPGRSAAGPPPRFSRGRLFARVRPNGPAEGACRGASSVRRPGPGPATIPVIPKEHLP